MRETSSYSDTEAGYYIFTLHCWKDTCCATRKPEELLVIATGYILHAYVLKLVLSGIYFCYTVLLDFIHTLTISFWISYVIPKEFIMVDNLYWLVIDSLTAYTTRVKFPRIHIPKVIFKGKQNLKPQYFCPLKISNYVITVFLTG